MIWQELVSGPVATLIAGIGGAVVAQASYWVHAHRRGRARQLFEAAGVARARLDNEETANERLFRTFDERLRGCEQRYTDSERLKHELEERVNSLTGTIIRLNAALDIMRAGYSAAGLKEPKLPLLADV